MDSQSAPLFSIILAVKNSEDFIEATLCSILNQTFRDFEVIIIDGASIDSTLSILSKYKEHIQVLSSEPDKGISDAFNKGIALSRGRYLNFQGDSDGFVSNDVLGTCSNLLHHHNFPSFLSTRIYRTDYIRSFLTASPIVNRVFFRFRLFYSMCIPHQGLFTSRSYFARYGSFSLNLKYSMDYEHILRSWDSTESFIFSNFISSYWSGGGIGANLYYSVIKEYVLCKRMNLKYPVFLFYTVFFFQSFVFKVKSLVSRC